MDTDPGTPSGGTRGELARDVHVALLRRGETLGCAESLTGGDLASLLSSTPGASGWFRGGVVSYATDVKRRLLGVTAPRVISADCAAQMATGVRSLLEVDWALATTGVAGPDQQEDQPAGTVFVAVAGPERVRTSRLALRGDRAAIREASCRAAMGVLLEEVGA
ncbi:MAG TPA: CinA family protein [Marmoricola sp.]|nr:CinA family protein [Marmoricola sp.]